MADASTTQLQGLIDRMNAGDPAARDVLIHCACGRLERLARKMLQSYSRLKTFEDTADVLQSSMVRLLRALQVSKPISVQDFFRLAASQIRRELIDLARHYYGPEGSGANRAAVRNDEISGAAFDAKAESTSDPGRLTLWTDFHQEVQKLPAEEREVFSLVWYHEMTQAEAAAVLNVSVPTVKRWWLLARLRLRAALNGEAPAS